MIFWNVEKLANQLKNGDLSSRQKLRYLLLAFVFLAVTPYAYLGEEYNSAYGLEIMVVLFTTIWGILYCHEANEEGDGKDFFERFICIGFPIGIRLIVLVLPAYFVISMILAFLFPGKNMEFSLFDVVVTAFIEIVFYLRVRKWMGYIARGNMGDAEQTA